MGKALQLINNPKNINGIKLNNELQMAFFINKIKKVNLLTSIQRPSAFELYCYILNVDPHVY